jgi:hypothetical protein
MASVTSAFASPPTHDPLRLKAELDHHSPPVTGAAGSSDASMHHCKPRAAGPLAHSIKVTAAVCDMHGSASTSMHSRESTLTSDQHYGRRLRGVRIAPLSPLGRITHLARGRQGTVAVSWNLNHRPGLQAILADRHSAKGLSHCWCNRSCGCHRFMHMIQAEESIVRNRQMQRACLQRARVAFFMQVSMYLCDLRIVSHCDHTLFGFAMFLEGCTCNTLHKAFC